MLTRFKDKHVLLLQGPLGPFFKRLSKDLRDVGAKVTKINFCGGDDFFYRGKEVIHYKDTLYNWPKHLRTIITERNIDAILLLGDCRPYHVRAKTVADNLGVEFFVFEEGYIRPKFITLEKGGVNGHSTMSDDPQFYLDAKCRPREDLLPIGKTFGRSAWYAIAYYIATTVSSLFYHNYVHHRPNSLLKHGFAWVRGLYRKIKYRLTESRFLSELTGQWHKKFFLFPLQVHNDYQFKHAKYNRIEDCIEEVIASFAASAPTDIMLVIKHHPADRPYRDYTDLIKKLSIKYLVSDRILYVHDLHLPTLLRSTLGCVLMNSTVGLSALFHGTPVKVLGKAIYKVSGLTYEGSLEQFWHNPGHVNMRVYEAFRGWLEHNNQYNGNFYRPIRQIKNHCGVDWTDRTKKQ